MAGKKGKFKTTQPSGLSWFKNAGKSLGYSSMDIITEMMPATMDNITTNKDTITDVVNSIRTIKTRRNARLEDILTGAAKENLNTLKAGIQNAKDDLRSGKIYNKGRLESAIEDDWNIDMDSFNLSDDLDDSNFSDSSSDDKQTVVSPNITINSNITKNNPMVKALHSQTDAIVRTTEASMQQDFKIAASSMSLTKQIGDNLYNGLSAINDNLGLLVNFQSNSMAKYIGASLQYYEENLKIVNSTLEEYKRVNAPRDKQTTRADDSADNVFSYNGALNLGEYGKLVKKQLGSFVDNDLFLSSFKNIFTDTDSLSKMATQPLKFISDTIAKKLIPDFTKQALNNFDKSLSAFVPAIFMKLNNLKNSDNGFLQAIGSIFGIKSENKTTVDTSIYDRGPMPFDGLTQKAITEVIPGYLSRILSALSGQNAVAYDYEKGRFEDITKIKGDWQLREKNTILNSYDSMTEIKDRLNAYDIVDQKQKDSLLEKIDDLFMKITDKDGLINPEKRKDKDGFTIDELGDLLRQGERGASSAEVELIRSLILSLDKNQIMKTFGKDAMSARRARTDLYYGQENTSGTIGNLLFNNLYGKMSDITPKDFRQGASENSLFMPKDKFGNNTLTYLRSIQKILLEGITVYIGDNSSSFINERRTALQKIKNAEKQKNEDENSGNTSNRERSTEEIQRNRDRGVETIDGIDDLLGIDDDVIHRQVRSYVDYRDAQERDKQKGRGVGIGKFLKGTLQEKYNMMRETINKAFALPANAIKSLFTKLDNSMYEIVFGSDKDQPGERQSFFSSLLTKLSSNFGKFFNYLKTKIYEPLKESLFGEKGLITEFKNSATYQKLKDKAHQFGNYLFGEKDPEGIRKGGLFSDTANELGDMFKGFRHYFTGNEYKDRNGNTIPKNEDSVFGHVKKMFTGFKNTMKEYFFGSKDADVKGKATGIISDVLSSLRDGFQSFSDAIFGPKEINGKQNKNHIIVSELTAKIKERMPKSLAFGVVGAGAGLIGGGSLGILGSLFLPGGPIGGALVGTAIGFLSQSDTFKNWLFGKVDANTNERMGGFITKSTQDFLKKNKTGIVGGATLGAVKSLLGFGFLPGFIVGGPIGGAIMGMGVSMLAKSESFQKMLFGEKDQDGKRTGGFVNKLMGKMNDQDSKKRLGTIGAGILGGLGIGTVLSQFGVLGALAFGPFSGAIAGAAAGIALTSDRWKKALFGEVKEDNGEVYRKGGLLTKFNNMVQVEILQPLKVKLLETKFNLQNWFDEKIAEPLLDSLAPIKEEIKRLKENVTQFFINMGQKIVNSPLFQGAKEYLFDPVVEGFKKYIFDPFKKIGDFLLKGAGKVIGGVVSMPFKALNFVADKLVDRHRKQGIRSYRDMIWNNIKQSEFVQKTLKPIFEPIKNGVDLVVDYTKKAIKGTFRFFGKMLKWGVKTLFKTVGGVLTAPFKAIAAPFKAISAIKKNIKLNGNKEVGNQGRLDSIRSGNRGFLRSIGDLASLANPFSSLRHDAQFSEEGAGYESERQKQRRERAEAREQKKQQRADTLAAMKDQLNLNQQMAKALGYDTEDADGKRSNAIYKDIDKQMQSQYGKDWKSMSKIDRDRFKSDRIAQITSDKIQQNTGNTVSEIQKTNDLLNRMMRGYGADDSDSVSEMTRMYRSMSQSELDDRWNGLGAVPNIDEKGRVKDENYDVNKSEDEAESILQNSALAQQLKAAQDVNETEQDKRNNDKELKKEMEARQAAVSTNTYDNQIKEKGVAADRKREWAWKTKLLNLIGKGNDDREHHKLGWDTIFSKKGLIGAGLILALPWIIKFFKDPVGTLAGLIGNIWDGIKNGIGWMNNNDTRRTPDGSPITNSDFNESLIVGGINTASHAAKAAIKGGKKIQEGWGAAKKIYSSIFKPKISANAASWVKEGVKSTDDLIELGVRNADDLASMGVRGVNDLAAVGVKSADDLAKLGIKSVDDLAKLGIEPTKRNLAKFGITNADDLAKFGFKAENALSKVGGKLLGVVDNQANMASWVSDGVKSTDDLVKLGVTSADDLASMGVKGWDNLATLGVKTSDDLARLGVTSADDLAKLGIKPTAKSLAKAGVSVSDDVIKAADESLIKKFIPMAKEGIAKLVGMFTKKFPNAAKATGVILSKVGSYLTASKLGKFVAKISAGIGKIATSTATFYILDALMVTWGGITGAFEAGRLFGVDPSRVDWKMRTISGLMKGITNFSWLFVIDILNDIITELTGMDLLRYLATIVYKCVSDEEDDIKLDDAQTEYRAEWEAYNADEMAKDPEFKGISFDAYIDMKQKTVGQKIVDGVKYGLDKTGDFLFGEKAYATDEKGNVLKDANGNNIVQLDKYGNEIRNANTAQNIVSGVGRGIAAVGTLGISEIARGWNDKAIYQTDANGNAVLDATGKPIAATATGKETKEEIEAMYGKGAYIAEDGTIKQSGTWTNIKTGASNAWNAVKTGASNAWNATTNAVSTGWNNVKTGVSDWWNKDLIDENGNPIIDEQTGKPIKANGLNNFFSNTLTKVGYFAKGVGKSVAEWWDSDMKDENGNPIIDEITGNPVKSRGVNNFFTNTLPGLGIKIGGFVSDAGKAVSGWWNDNAVDANGNQIIDDMTGQPVKANAIHNFFSNTLQRAGMHVSNWMSDAGKAVSGWWNDNAVDADGNPIIDDMTGEPVKANAIHNFFSNTLQRAGMHVNNWMTDVGKSVSNWWNEDSLDENGDPIIDDMTGEPVKANAIHNFFSNTLQRAGMHVTNWMSDTGKAVSNWWNAESLDENGDPIIDDMTGEPVKSNAVHNFFTNTLQRAGMHIGGWMSDIGKSVSNWWNEDLKDEDGNVIIDKTTNKPVKSNGLNNFFSNTLPSIGSKIGSWFSGIGDWVDEMIEKGSPQGSGLQGGIDLPVPNLKPNPNQYGTFKDKYGNILGMGEPMDLYNKYTMTSPYGMRGLSGSMKMHTGVDLSVGNDKPIPSFTDGTVTKVVSNYAPNSGWYKKGVNNPAGYGNYVMVKDKTGKYNLYGHLNKTNVKVGDTISEGSQIGLQGHTGQSTGSHLHYEVRKSEGGSTHTDPVAHLKSYKSANAIAPGSDFSSISGTASTQTTPGTGLLGFSSGLSDALSQATTPLTDFGAALTDTMNSILGAPSTTSSTNTSGSSGSNSSGASNVRVSATLKQLMDNPTNAEEELLGKILKSTVAGESGGDYNIVSPDDNGSYSVGLIQQHGPKASQMFTSIANKLSDPSLKQQALNYANMSNRVLSSSEASAMKQFLTHPTVSPINISVQDEMSKNQVLGNMRVPLGMYKDGTFMDMRSVLIPTDIGNTGPAHLDTWKPNYTKASNKAAELSHVRDSLKSTASWWGRQSNSKHSRYYKGWMNRIDNAYRDANSWVPKFGTGGIDLPVSDSDINKFVDYGSQKDTFKDNKIYGKGGISYMTRDPYVTMGSSKISPTTEKSSDSSIFKQMIDVLIEIATNTGSSSDYLKDLKDKAIESINNIQTNNGGTTIVSGDNNVNPMYNIAQNRRREINQKNYSTAKLIAQGAS